MGTDHGHRDSINTDHKSSTGNKMDKLMKLKNLEVDTIGGPLVLASSKNESFFNHLDLSNLNEMHFESNLARTLTDKMPSIIYEKSIGPYDALMVDNSHDVIGQDWIL